MRALEIFYEICKIPHPSFNTAQLWAFIVDFAKKNRCEVESDESRNIHISRGNPRFCFQAHYDMVLIGETIEPIALDGKLCARNSSLGADNGMALACILALIEGEGDIEALITNDEEVGMIGANNLNLGIKAKSIINLDSENINEIVVGCAGGFDANIALKCTSRPRVKQNLYKLEARGFLGGHSGIDINKGIQNAIVELLWAVSKIDCEIVCLKGGEKRNSIPINASGIIATDEILEIPQMQKCAKSPHISITKLENSLDCEVFSKEVFDKNEILQILKIHNGIYEISESSVISSLNISIINVESKSVESLESTESVESMKSMESNAKNPKSLKNQNLLQIMVRANKNELLNRQMSRLKLLFGDSVSFSGLYAPWEREDSALLDFMEKLYQKHEIPYKIIEIHAGLECGILKNKCDEIISIGPTIENPHSRQEKLDLASLEKFMAVLEDLAK